MLIDMRNRMRPGKAARPARQRGSSLVEVLVSVLLLAVGILGLAKVQGLSISSTKVSNSRSMAAYQASSMVAAIRANPAYWRELAPLRTDAIIAGKSGLTAGSCVDHRGAAANPMCDATQMAAFDLGEWAMSVAETLPQATAWVECPAVTGVEPRRCDVNLKWMERQVGVASDSATRLTAAGTTTGDTAGTTAKAVGAGLERSYRLSVWP